MAKPQDLEGPLSFEQWKYEFRKNICYGVAKTAWADIDSHGISNLAERLLHAFACQSPEGAIRRPVLEQAQRIAGLCENTVRAVRVAEEEKCNPRAEMFQERATEKLKQLASEPYISPNPSSPDHTFAQELAANPVLGATSPDRLPGFYRWAAEDARREGGKLFLGALRVYAENHGVKLSVGQTAILAQQADPKRVKDYLNLKRSLLRWMRGPSAKRRCQQLIAWIETAAPPPSEGLKTFLPRVTSRGASTGA